MGLSEISLLALKEHLFDFSSNLDCTLAEQRQAKWLRDGVRPEPFVQPKAQKLQHWTRRAGQKKRTRKKRVNVSQPSLFAGNNAGDNARPEQLERTIVNLSTHALTGPQRSLLQKGLTFCPTATRINRLQLIADLDSFYRRLRLHNYFTDKSSTASQTGEVSALQETALRRQSHWQPPRGTVTPEVEVFINVFHRRVQEAMQRLSGPLSLQDNLTTEERLALASLKGKSDIVIRPADKGSAIVIQDKEAYHREVMRQLSDPVFYKQLSRDPTADHQAQVRKAVQSLQDSGSINSKTARDLVEVKVRAPHFYILPKIHKRLDSPPGRPIVSSNRAPTERISAFVDLQLKPIVSSLPSSIKDTKDFLLQLQSLPPLPPGAILFTMDVVGLYTNIPQDGGLAACEEMLCLRTVQEPPTSGIIKLARLVLELNAFTYEGTHYLQVRGTAMGTRMAPSYANIFMGVLERKIMATAPDKNTPVFYKRFIDDVFGIWTHGEEALLRFFEHSNNANENIQFTFKYGQSVEFLDTVEEIVGDTITTDLYTKPTNTHQYLLPSSDHPPLVHRHLPYGLAIRIRAIVSEDSKLEHRLAELSGFLITRGYSKTLVATQINKAKAKPRDDVLRSSGQRGNRDRIPLACTWNSSLPPLREFLQEAFPILQSTERLRKTFRLPLVAYRRPKNLRDFLVTTGPQPKVVEKTSNGTFSCKSPRCKTCVLVRNLEAVCCGDRPLHQVTGHFDCSSSSLVYLISCSKCSAVYVGETGQTLRERMNGHRHDIKTGADTPVALHFLEDGHTVRVSVIQRSPVNTVQRRAVEREWIQKFRNDGDVQLLNRDDGMDILLL